jgi:hypothetical protein
MVKDLKYNYDTNFAFLYKVFFFFLKNTDKEQFYFIILPKEEIKQCLDVMICRHPCK